MTKNRKWIAGIVLCLAFTIVGSFVVFALNDTAVTKLPKDIFSRFSKIIHQCDSISDDEVGFVIYGNEILMREVDQKKALLERAQNRTVSYDEVVENIVKNRATMEEAKKRGIDISLEEARKRSLQEKDEIYTNSPKDQIIAVEEYIKALGISEDEYWNNYNAKEYQVYMTAIALHEKIIKEGETAGKIEKFAQNTGETKEIQKKFVEDYIEKNILPDVKIDVVNNELKANLEEIGREN